MTPRVEPPSRGVSMRRDGVFTMVCHLLAWIIAGLLFTQRRGIGILRTSP